MNQITTVDRSTLAPAEKARGKPPSAVLKPHLGPHIGRRRFGQEFGEFLKAIGRVEDCHHGAWYADMQARHRREAEEIAAALPGDAELERLRDAYAAAAEGRATRKEIAAITAALLDALPTFDAAKAPGYLDGLLFALEVEAEAEPFSAQALAGAAFRLMRAETFAPPPDKLLSAIREEQEGYRGRSLVLAHVIKGKDRLRKVAA